MLRASSSSSGPVVGVGAGAAAALGLWERLVGDPSSPLATVLRLRGVLDGVPPGVLTNAVPSPAAVFILRFSLPRVTLAEPTVYPARGASFS